MRSWVLSCYDRRCIQEIIETLLLLDLPYSPNHNALGAHVYPTAEGRAVESNKRGVKSPEVDAVGDDYYLVLRKGPLFCERNPHRFGDSDHARDAAKRDHMERIELKKNVAR